MQKNLENGLQVQSVNVLRVDRKIFFSGEVCDDSIFELIRILHEIEEEDNGNGEQDNTEDTIVNIFDTFEMKDEKLSKEELKEIEKIGNTYRKNKKKPNSFDRKPIHLYLSSRGGDAYECIGATETIRTIKTPVWGYTYKAMSSGLFIFESCNRRIMYRNGTLLYHQVQAGTNGTVTDMVEDTNEAMRLQTLMEDLTLGCTNISEERLNEVREKKIDWYINSENALELGMIDEII